MPILAGIVILTNFYFIPHYGIVGAAFATVLSKFIFNIAMFLFLLLKYKMQPFTWRNLYVVAIGIGVVLLVGIIPDKGSFILDVTVRSFAVTALFVPAMLLPKISSEINNMITTLIDKVKGKKN